MLNAEKINHPWTLDMPDVELPNWLKKNDKREMFN